MTRIVVVGGGIAGLATAALLSRGGADVTLLERHDVVGGRAVRLETHGFSFDCGPWWFVAPEIFERFFALLGRDSADYLEVADLDPRFRAFFEGMGDAPADVIDLRLDTQANADAFDALSRGDGEAAQRFLAEAAEDYHLALEHIMYSTLGNPLASVQPALVRKLPRLLTLFARSLDSRLTSSIHHPRVRQVLGFPAVALAGSPAHVPGTHGFVAQWFLGSAVRHPTGGFAAVADAFAKIAIEEGVTIRTNADVARILVDPHTRHAGGVVLHGGGVVAADIVVSCADLHHTETELLTEGFQTYPEHTWHALTPSPSALVIAVGVKKKVPELAHHNLLFPRELDAALGGLSSQNAGPAPTPAFAYVSRVSATELSAAPKGKDTLVITVPMPADPLLGATDSSKQGLAALAETYVDQVGRWCGVPDLRSKSEIYAVLTPADMLEKYSLWRGSALGLASTRRQTGFGRPRNASKKVRNLYYAGASTHPGLGMPSALIAAELVAKRLMNDQTSRAMPTPVEPGFLTGSRKKGPLGTTLRNDTPSE